ncbi:MAG: DUF2950 domain-containing protein [Candidatus Solibacter sp.]
MRFNLSTVLEKKVLLAVLATALFPASALRSQTAPQKGFTTANEAAVALIQAAGNFDTPALLEILGSDGKDLVGSDDPTQGKNQSVAFAALAKEKTTVVVDPAKPTRAILKVGNDDWPLPIPIVKKSAKWYFDSKAGRQEILFRRIGANELDAIEVCRGYVEAQLEYASTIHDNSGIAQYAQKLISTPGKQDGLYWKNADGTPGGPVSEGVAKAIQEGYTLTTGAAFHGYYFKLLKGQGPAAPNGEIDYVINGVMIGGFGLLATPAEYRVTGVQTFMINHDGIVYQKDLGPDSVNLAKQIEKFNPDKTWRRTDDDWSDK